MVLVTSYSEGPERTEPFGPYQIGSSVPLPRLTPECIMGGKCGPTQVEHKDPGPKKEN
jgi:hypothetical protein